MKDPRPQPIRREDYRPPNYLIDAVELRFELGDSGTEVHARMQMRRNRSSAAGPVPLRLHGERLKLLELRLDDVELTDDAFALDAEGLTVHTVPAEFVLQTRVRIHPESNSELSGLYRSGTTFCTQCEAEGFRRITYYLDRPDVMAKYRTTVVADANQYPVLLSNGNRVDAGDAGNGRHFVTWEDPQPKPSYLFALVAADLRCHRGTFTTQSGRAIDLEIWVEPANVDACEHALRSLQRAMQWDETVYGREYDLDVYMIVAVSDFNMGAMENKGLNVFNAKYVLARPETATDDDYEAIEGVIAHEYFHNWTGNRVTCRDWFQLTLKEGLTVFRDEQFTADMTSAAVKRIADVRVLRTSQFAEDSSPTAHPIRPDSYIEMNNFYTATVYNKGAEVVRMLHTLLGPDGFRAGMDLYFERHDGQAVTCDDFRAAMADANAVDLDQFAHWYAQAGTPIVEAEGVWEPEHRRYTLNLRQLPPANASAKDFPPLHVPVAVGLIAQSGADVALHPRAQAIIRGTTAILQLCEPHQSFVFEDVEGPVVPSVLRMFSAPVKLKMDRSFETLAFLMGHDSDPFSRWDAAQSAASTVLLSGIESLASGSEPSLDTQFVAGFGKILSDERLDGSLRALTLRLPDERLLAQHLSTIDVDGLHASRRSVMAQLGRMFEREFAEIYQRYASAPYSIERAAIDARRLKHVALEYLVAGHSEQATDWCVEQFARADNMSDAQAALTTLIHVEGSARDSIVAEFYERWSHDPLVLDKWFSAQALSERHDTLDRVIELSGHPAFTLRNPNRVRALLGSFALRNQVRFHSADGRGYAFITERILELDAINPNVAARLMAAFSAWRRFDRGRGERMRGELTRIVETRGLSSDVFELASKILGR